VCLKAHLRARVGGRVEGRVEGVEAFEGVVVVSCDWLQRTRDGSHTNGQGKEEFACDEDKSCVSGCEGRLIPG